MRKDDDIIEPYVKRDENGDEITEQSIFHSRRCVSIPSMQYLKMCPHLYLHVVKEMRSEAKMKSAPAK